jgi:hypothetical protein
MSRNPSSAWRPEFRASSLSAGTIGDAMTVGTGVASPPTARWTVQSGVAVVTARVAASTKAWGVTSGPLEQ